MTISICPHCLRPFTYFDKDYRDGEIKAVKVDVENPECSVFLTNSIYQNTRCSNIQNLKTQAGKIAKNLNLSKEEKKLFFQKVTELKRKYPRWKDYKILELALNSISGGDVL